MDLGIVDHAIADSDRMVETCQDLAAPGRLDPKAQPANLHGLFVQVDAVEVVLKDSTVEIKQRLMSAKLL